MSLFSARMKRFQSKMKTLECPKHFSNYKSMGILSDAQGQLTPKTIVGSCQNSNSVENLWLSFLPARMNLKRIQSKMEALECSQHYTLIFRHLRTGNFVVSGRIWLNFKLIKAFNHVLVSCKNDKVPIKNEDTRVAKTFHPLQIYGDFIRCSRAANSDDH